MAVKIFAMTHKRFEVPNDPMYIPLHVGHKNAKEDFGYTGDDTGDNISDLNCYYAELSGVYWVWKNYFDADYVGVCHYRRFLTSEEGYAFSEAEYERILEEYDIITTKQLVLPGSYRNGFGAHHKVGTLDETGRIIAEFYPEYYDTFVSLVHQNKTYFGNIMVAGKKLYDAYCEWLFTIFFELQRRIDLTFEDDYHKRVFGFISEFLLYVWVTANGYKAFECRVAMIGEKKETKEVTEKMAEFFREKDAAGAKAYFETVLKQRPDILMEASDINGECKLCLQAVSTANLELAEYGHCFLERKSDYASVINYFRNLNSLAAGAVRAVSTDREVQGQTGKAEYVRTIKAVNAADAIDHTEKNSCGEAAYLAETGVTDVALRAAVRLFAPSQDIAQRAYQYCKNSW
ncbi:MAG: DUF4422 domain-containing protein [Lachnospiraceae bacterium]|nr:DUF4422 domain-containing protein [Lachnospiraceae bacterium]